MAAATDVAAARAMWKDPGTPVHQRCLAARAIGLLDKHGPSWQAEGVDDDESSLGRARRHGTRDANRRRTAEDRSREKEEAIEKMRQLGTESLSDVIVLMRDRSETSDRREAAAFCLSGLRRREATEPLIDVLAEGHAKLSWMCMWALTKIGSRRHARKLMDIVRGDYPLPARQEAIYTLWQLQEVRAESLFVQVSAAVESEEEYTRDMATEALGNTSRRHGSQRALAARLFDPSISVRYAALCRAAACILSPTPFLIFFVARWKQSLQIRKK